MAGAYEYLTSLLGKKKEAQNPPPAVAQKPPAKPADDIKALNPVDPSGGWFQKLLNKPAEAQKQQQEKRPVKKYTKSGPVY